MQVHSALQSDPVGLRDPVLEVKGLGKSFGSGPSKKQVIQDLSLVIEPNTFVSIVGPSGAGKTTLLRCLCGLMAPSEGTAFFEGQAIAGPPVGLALVFQDYSRSLLPWLTIRDNLALPIQRLCHSAEVRRRIEAALSEVGLEGADKLFPWQMSGGMQQRAAIARALAFQPDVMLMDEPFAAVDAQTRADLEDLMLKVQADLNMTIVFVTHDIDESIYLSDRVLVLSGSPTKVTREIDVNIPRPRDQVTTKALPEFIALRTEVFGLIRAAKSQPAARAGAQTEVQPA